MNQKFLKTAKMLFRLLALIVAVVFYPIGLIWLGYVIGYRKASKLNTFKESRDKPSVLVESQVPMEQNELVVE